MMTAGNVLLFIILAGVLFINKVKLTKRRRNTLAATSFILFILLLIKDMILALIFTSIAYIVISKVEIAETFDTVKLEKKVVKKEEIVKEQPGVKKDKNVSEPKVVKKDEVAVPSHCKNNDLDKEFLKEYEIDTSKLEAVQTNVFDKYNYNVFYNELGENSLDIQGIHNHEVAGYEK